MRNCDLQILDLQTYFPYRFFQPGYGFSEGCEVYGQGFIAVPMGRQSYVCVFYQQQSYGYGYQVPNPFYGYGGYYGGFGAGFYLGLDFLLHLNL